MKKKDSGGTWTPSEITFVEKHYLLYPPFEVARRLRYLPGTVARSHASTKDYMKRQSMLGLDISVREFYTAKELYTSLGCHRKRFLLWQQNGLETLQEKPGQTFLYVTKASFVAFARRNPTHLFGITRKKLEFFLPSELVDYIDGLPRDEINRPTSFPKRVKCLRNGFVYPSVSEAARSNNIPIDTLHTALKRGTKCYGMSWEVID